MNLVLLNVHLLDHVLRGRRIHANGLNPDWVHSGWPFRPEFTPFDIAALVLNVLLVTAIVLGGSALWIHFFYGQKSESPSVIMRSYDNPTVGVPALIVLFGLLAGILVMAWQAAHTHRVSGRW